MGTLKYLLAGAVLVISLGAYGQFHCRVRYQYNAAGDRTQRDWHCWLPGSSEDPDLEEGYKRLTILDSINLEVMPNPSSSQFVVTLSNKDQGGQLELIDLTGSVVHAQPFTGGRSIVDVEHIPSGHYFVRFSSGTECIVSSCVVQH